MQKCLCLLLAMLLCAAGLPARAEETYIIKPLQPPQSRVKLRKSPSTGAEILGQYYAGTPMTVLTTEDGWAQVLIEGRKGWMMSEFLTRDGSSETGADLPRGYLIPSDGEDRLMIFDAPNLSAEVTAFALPWWISVLGTAGEDWLHVRAYMVASGADEGYPVSGFVHAWQIGQSDREGITVSSGSAEGTVNFREGPSRKDGVIGRLFSGAPVHILFDDHVADDGWQKVRVGDRIGYIMDEYLTSVQPALYRPPIEEIAGDTAQTYVDPDGENPLITLGRYDPVYVLGVFGEMYYVRIETWLTETEYGDMFAFVPMRDMQRKVTRSARAQATILRDTPVYWEDGQGGLYIPNELADVRLAAGTTVCIYGGVLDLNHAPAAPNDYIWPTSEYLLVNGIAENGNGVSAYVPIDAVAFDEELLLPEAFTVG